MTHDPFTTFTLLASFTIAFQGMVFALIYRLGRRDGHVALSRYSSLDCRTPRIRELQRPYFEEMLVKRSVVSAQADGLRWRLKRSDAERRGSMKEFSHGRASSWSFA
jgi:hypothetical protein